MTNDNHAPMNSAASGPNLGQAPEMTMVERN